MDIKYDCVLVIYTYIGALFQLTGELTCEIPSNSYRGGNSGQLVTTHLCTVRDDDHGIIIWFSTPSLKIEQIVSFFSSCPGEEEEEEKNRATNRVS